MIEVRFSTYSPADLPSSTRPAPAKKRRLSQRKGISSSRKAPRGLPASAASRSASSSAWSSSRSASLMIAAARSPGVVAAQPGKARFAAATARSTSSSAESCISAIASPVAGFVTSSVSPSAASTNSPSMKFWSLVLVAVAMCLLSLCGDAQDVLYGRVLHARALRDRGMGDLAVGHVNSRLQTRQLLDRSLQAMVGQGEHVRQRGVREREGRGNGHGTRHVCNAVMGDAVDLVHRVGVGRGMRGLEAAALVDRYVNQHGALLHQAALVAFYDVGGASVEE